MVTHLLSDEVERNDRGRFSEPNELHIGARPRREALGTEMKRFEQVRLARPVRTDDENDPARQHEIERCVGTVVPERDAAGNQPASRIGMIR
jgi:hypothetical protein